MPHGITVLPATRQRWHSHPYPSQSRYSIKRPRRDARLSWPNALNTLVSRAKPGFQALSKGLIVLLRAEVVRQGVPDHDVQHAVNNTALKLQKSGTLCLQLSEVYQPWNFVVTTKPTTLMRPSDPFKIFLLESQIRLLLAAVCINKFHSFTRLLCAVFDHFCLFLQCQ